MLVRFRLDCDHKRVSRSDPRVFNHNSVQQVGTYIQDAHSAPSIKGKSRSASKKRTASHPTMLPLNSQIATSPKKNKVSTNCSSTRENARSFNFIVLCSKFDQKWYLRYRSGNCKCNGNHKGHIPVHSAHIS